MSERMTAVRQLFPAGAGIIRSKVVRIPMQIPRHTEPYRKWMRFRGSCLNLFLQNDRRRVSFVILS